MRLDDADEVGVGHHAHGLAVHDRDIERAGGVAVFVFWHRADVDVDGARLARQQCAGFAGVEIVVTHGVDLLADEFSVRVDEGALGAALISQIVEPAAIRTEIAVEPLHKVLVVGLLADVALARIPVRVLAHDEIVDQAVEKVAAAPTQEHHNRQIERVGM